MWSEQDIEQLISYIKGNLPEAESLIVKDRIESDTTFKTEYEFQKQLIFMAKLDYLDEMKAKLNSVDKSYNNKSAKWGKIGLGVVSFAIVSSVAIYFSYDLNNDKVETHLKEKTIVKPEKAIPLSEKIEIKTLVKVEEKVRREEVITTPPQVQNITDKNLVELKASKMGLIEQEVKPNNPKDSLPIVKTKLVETKVPPIIKEEALNNKEDIIRCIKPEIQVKIVSSSFDLDNGVINIRSDSKLNYRIKELQSGYNTTGSFYDLAAGSYEISVTDSLNCSFEMGTYSVGVNPCSHKKNYAYNVTFDREWMVPVNQNAILEIKIMSERGQLIYNAQNFQNENVTWNGMTNENEKVILGLYKVFVTTKEKEQCIYNVIIEE